MYSEAVIKMLRHAKYADGGTVTGSNDGLSPELQKESEVIDCGTEWHCKHRHRQHKQETDTAAQGRK